MKGAAAVPNEAMVVQSVTARSLRGRAGQDGDRSGPPGDPWAGEGALAWASGGTRVPPRLRQDRKDLGCHLRPPKRPDLRRTAGARRRPGSDPRSRPPLAVGLEPPGVGLRPRDRSRPAAGAVDGLARGAAPGGSQGGDRAGAAQTGVRAISDDRPVRPRTGHHGHDAGGDGPRRRDGALRGGRPGSRRRILGTPSDHTCAYMVAIGYPAGRPLTPIATPDRRPSTRSSTAVDGEPPTGRRRPVTAGPAR